MVTTRRLATATWLTLAVALGGCTLITDSFLTNEFSGDPFPINVDTASGAILVGVRQGDLADRTAVLDLLSPITIAEPEMDEPVAASYVDLTLLGEANGTLVPRARFVDAQVISFHPCPAECDASDPACNPAQCNVGTPTDPRPFEFIIGADVLAGDAVRLRLGDDPQLFILPDVAGSDRGRSLACDAVFRAPYRGGGTLVIAGTELPFGNRRITLQACLGQDPAPAALPASITPTTFNQHGADALFVVSTSIGISILGQSAYQRYLVVHPLPVDAPAPVAMTVYLPSGPVTGTVAMIDRLALVAAPTSNALSPCRQLYAHRLLAAKELGIADCQTTGTPPVSPYDCPCKDPSLLFCPVPAVLELAPAAGLQVLVVSDTDPTLQALRTELRPDQPEVDGLLGTDALRAAEIDVDYPHDRLIARCRDATSCTARPQLAQFDDRCQINRCITGIVDSPGCPTP